jgi:outer membrane protein OmpA-like peptidoglycan-associated protein
MKRIGLLLTAVLLVQVGAVFAQAPKTSATVDEIVKSLAPTQAPTTRSLGRNLVPEVKSIDLVIQFDFDSAKLQDVSKPLLDGLAQALNTDRLRALDFKVEGHTDAKGTPEYNQNLSAHRANTVVAYLVLRGVERSRLIAEGKGFSDLLTPQDPYATVNRRVRITTQSK